ncbi:MAG TPA: hypothetical protein DIT78_05680, partial [Gammaproteobacteria bacterium]|nr:hypothetical protein [Gammaproteobacteria bacterium]
TTEPSFIQQAEQLLSAFSADINQDPYSYSSFILGFNHAIFTEAANVQYAYQGRIRVHTQTLDNDELLVNLSLNPLWHINSNQPIQDSLIATKITNLDTQNWTLEDSTYPQGELAKLGFSKDQISIYKDQAKIGLKLKQHSKTYITPTLLLTLQACSDKVCLPPTTITLKP